MKGIGLAIGALVAAEATGVTNFSGGSGDVSVEMPKAPDSPIPSPGATEPTIVMPETGDGSLDPGAIASIAEAARPDPDTLKAIAGGNNDSTQAIIAALAASRSGPNVPTDGQEAGNDVREWLESRMPDPPNDENEVVSHGGGSENAYGEPQTTGGKLGKNLGEFVWHSSSGPLAQAIDRNIGFFSGNADDTIGRTADSIKSKIPDPDVRNPMRAARETKAEIQRDAIQTVTGTDPFANNGSSSVIDRVKDEMENSSSSESSSTVPETLKKAGSIFDQTPGVYENDGRLGL